MLKLFIRHKLTDLTENVKGATIIQLGRVYGRVQPQVLLSLSVCRNRRDTIDPETAREVTNVLLIGNVFLRHYDRVVFKL